MANEFKHASVGAELTQAEWEGTEIHVFNSQATGDILYASSATQLSRLPIGSGILTVSSGVPAWSTNLPSGLKLSGTLDGNGQAITGIAGLQITAGYAIYVSNSTQELDLYGGAVSGDKGAGIFLYGSDNAGNGGLSLATTNAAKTGWVTRMNISGNTAGAVVNWTNATHVYNAASLPDGDPHAAGQIYYTSADGIVRRSNG
jgi:hypothetical protein